MNKKMDELYSEYVDFIFGDDDDEQSVINKRIRLSTVKSAIESEDVIGKSIIDYTKDDFIKMFNMYKWTDAYSSFYPRRITINQFLIWLMYEKNVEVTSLAALKSVRADELGSTKYSTYFKNETEFLDCMDAVLKGDEFIRNKAIEILFWYGFSKDEVMQMEIKDMDDETKTIRSVHFSDRAYAIIRSCANMKSYEVVRANDAPIKYDLQLSNYIIRKVRTGMGANEEISLQPYQLSGLNKIVNATAKKFGELSESSPYYGANIYPTELIRNGLFCRLAELNQTRPELFGKKSEANRKAIQRELNIKKFTRTTYLSTMSNYEAWAQTKAETNTDTDTETDTGTEQE